MTILNAIDLNLLVAFDALVAEGNVTRAGARIGLSQPALSKALGRLRNLFDDPLFIRIDGRMQPTARALQLADPVRRALTEIERAMVPAACFEPASAEGLVVLATVDLTDLLLLLPRVIAHLREAAPGLDVRVRPCDRLRLPGMLAGGEIDLALLPVGELGSDYRAEPLFQDTVTCLVAADHPSVRDELTIADFVDLPHIAVSTEGRGDAVIDSLLAIRGLERRVQLTVPTYLAVAPAVASSDLIATVPTRLAGWLAGIARLRLCDPPLPVAGFTVHQVWHSRTDQDPVQCWLRQVVKELAVPVDADGEWEDDGLMAAGGAA
jgi:DNA-binding transcriptional LysR family regulator